MSEFLEALEELQQLAGFIEQTNGNVKNIIDGLNMHFAEFNFIPSMIKFIFGILIICFVLILAVLIRISQTERKIDDLEKELNKQDKYING